MYWKILSKKNYNRYLLNKKLINDEVRLNHISSIIQDFVENKIPNDKDDIEFLHQKKMKKI